MPAVAVAGAGAILVAPLSWLHLLCRAALRRAGRINRRRRLGGRPPGGSSRGDHREPPRIVPADAVVTGAAVIAACGLAAVVAGPVAALFGAVGAVVGTSSLRRRRREAVAAARRSAELEILAAFAAELRSGRHPTAALSAVQAPAGPDLEPFLAAARATAALGGDVSAALRRCGAGAALSKLAAAWQLSEECGAPLAELVSQVAADVRATADLHRSVRVELTGARATGLVLAVLPLLGVALGAAMGARPLQVLLHTPAGAACAATGLAFELAGLAWVGRLTSDSRRGAR